MATPAGRRLTRPRLTRRQLTGAAVASATVGALGAVRAAETRTRARWTRTPDPTAGEPTTLGGETLTVATRDGGRLHVVRRGPSDGPQAVLVHGVTASVDEWAAVAHRLLDGGMQVVAYDQRGHRHSTVGEAGYGLGPLGDDLLDVLARCAGPGGDAVLVGHSMGGIAVLSALARSPATVNRARGVALVATLARAPDDPVTRLRGRLAASDLARRLMGRERSGRLLARAGAGAAPSLELLDGTRRNWTNTPTVTRAGFLRALRGFDLLDTVGRLERPAVVICGDADRVTPLAANEAIAARLPRGCIEVVAGAGHGVIRERPDVVAGHVLRLAGLRSAG